jgi:hypothetical protein
MAVCGWALWLTSQHVSTIILGIWLKKLLSTGPEAFHCNGYYLLLCLSLSSVPKLASPCVYHWLSIELLDWRHQIFLFYAPAFASWSTMVDPCPIPSDNVSQKSVIFPTIAVQQSLADSNGCTCPLL